MNEWKKCFDILPELGKEVIVCTEHGRMHIAVRKKYGKHKDDWYCKCNPWGSECWDDVEFGKIIYWTELPQLPDLLKG